MEIIHTLLFMVRVEYLEEDLIMAGRFFETVSKTPDATIVIYNQGCLSKEEVEEFLKPYQLNYYIIGEGENVGIPIARQHCFEFIWSSFPDVEFISEVHLDMLLPKNWHKPLVEYLRNNDDPMISPSIVTKSGEIFPKGNGEYSIPREVNDILKLLENITEEKLIKGFVHPVIHKASILKQIGGYDIEHLKGKVAYEDDSLLLGYLYYMGTRSNWFPKVNFNSVVYHEYLGQRLTISDKESEYQKNLNGLYKQYGTNGLKHLMDLHISESRKHFKNLYESLKKANLGQD